MENNYKNSKNQPEVFPLRFGTEIFDLPKKHKTPDILKLLDNSICESSVAKPWILIESTTGDSHPGSSHLGNLSKIVKEGVISNGGLASEYFCTDICDGIAQGSDAMKYSLFSRELIASAVEMHLLSGHFDGSILISSCDKALPAHLLAAARINKPTIIVPGGVMESGPHNQTLCDTGKYQGVDEFLKNTACNSKGCCAFFGTASTMQILSEALGLSLAGSALIPAHLNTLNYTAKCSGRKILELVEKQIKQSDIINEKSMENAFIVHAATGGSTNAILHLLALAEEFKIDFPPERINKINEKVPFILNIKPSGTYTADKIWYAGGVPKILSELKEFLNPDVMTVNGIKLGEVIENFEKSDYFSKLEGYLNNFGLKSTDIIRPIDKPVTKKGSILILKGNIAPEGAVIKVSAANRERQKFTGRAKVFKGQPEALKALQNKQIKPGDVLVISYEGPKATGMPEQFYITEAISSDPNLNDSVALITDGRFSGATRGFCIGHISPEAAENGPIAAIEDDDIITIDLNEKTINITGAKNTPLNVTEVDQILKSRLNKLEQHNKKPDRGLFGLYLKNANSASRGASINV